jgi:hypothetical protein
MLGSACHTITYALGQHGENESPFARQDRRQALRNGRWG